MVQDEEQTSCAVLVSSPLWPLQRAEPGHDRPDTDRIVTDDRRHPARPDAA